MSKLVDWRNRIVGVERMKVRELLAHPLNPKHHSNQQTLNTIAALEQIGKIDALRAYRREDGRLCLIDGHLRQSLDPDQEWTVLITDLSEDEAHLALATFDPIGWQAEHDPQILDALLRQTHTPDPTLQALLDELATEAGLYQDDPSPDKETKNTVNFLIQIDCTPEAMTEIAETLAEMERIDGVSVDIQQPKIAPV